MTATCPALLVVDDDPLFRTLVRRSLAEDFSVQSVADGHAALNTALAGPPAVIILDLNMPGWDGLRTLRAIRAEPSLSETATLVLASGAGQRNAELRDAGADGVLDKSEFTCERIREVAGSLRRATVRRPLRTVRRIVPEMVEG